MTDIVNRKELENNNYRNAPPSGQVWVEKYRPTTLSHTVLDPLNRALINNIIHTRHFPNLLLYGPPGTGKTTTVINLIKEYLNDQFHKELIIHLNASDERGIDTIRKQINTFVSSRPLFYTGVKFVILDEVDYMTKTAHQALRYLLQNYNVDVRFCLICNYISRIDDGLQNEFVRLRFNQLPKNDIIAFLKGVTDCENVQLTTQILSNIQSLFGSDIRSMINFIQSNHTIKMSFMDVIDNEVLFKLYTMLRLRNATNTTLDDAKKLLKKWSIKYNMDTRNIIKLFLNYIIRYQPQHVNETFMNFVENLIHNQKDENNLFAHYALAKLIHILRVQNTHLLP